MMLKSALPCLLQWPFPLTRCTTSSARNAMVQDHMNLLKRLRSILRTRVREDWFDCLLENVGVLFIYKHSFATHLLQGDTDIRKIQELPGHEDFKTTMIYTHMATVGAGIVSPLDRLDISDPVGL
jgi:hypothetical protein